MNEEKYSLVVDRWVFAKIFHHHTNEEERDDEFTPLCENILSRILLDCHSVLVYDGLPYEEWQDFRDVEFINRWIISMDQGGKIKTVPRDALERGLDQDEDQHYVEIALGTQDQIIITGDRLFKSNVDDRGDLEIEVWGIEEAATTLREYADI